MSIETNTIRPRPTGSIRGVWRERYGDQRVQVQVDPGRKEDTEIRVVMERRWGAEMGDVRRQDFWLTRVGAETLRDVLTAALEWSADDDHRI